MLTDSFFLCSNRWATAIFMAMFLWKVIWPGNDVVNFLCLSMSFLGDRTPVVRGEFVGACVILRTNLGFFHIVNRKK